MLVGPGCVGPRAEHLVEGALAVGREDDDEHVIERPPVAEVVRVADLDVVALILIRQVLVRRVGILPGEFLLAVIITGREGIMAGPLQGILRWEGLIDAFFSDQRKASRDQPLDQVQIATVAVEGLQRGMVIHVIDQLIRHDIHIGVAVVNESVIRIVCPGFND